MEIPTAVIHRLQSSLREAAAAAALDATPAPPVPSVADAVSAFDSGASAPVPAELRCGRCGAAGGFLRGAQSTLCAYCGSPRRGEGEGGGIAFRDGAAYRWLLGSLGLDGSEPVEFENETRSSNKSNEAPKSGMILSDLLDLKLTYLPEIKETPASFISKEQPSAAYTPDFSGANLDSFFIERKEETTAASAALPQTHTVVQENQTTDSKRLESSRSEMLVTSTGLMSSQRTNQIEATPAFANWDAEFQSTSSVSAAGDSKQLDLFQSTPAAASFSFPAAGTAINSAVGTGNKTNVKSTILEHSEDLASADGTIVKDNLSNQKVVQPILESNSGIVPENSVPDFAESALNMNSLKSNQLLEREDTGVNDGEAFDDWQEFTGGGNQGSSSSEGEHKEVPLKGDSSEIKTVDLWALGSVESPNNVNGDSSDDWQAFASSSGQGGEDLVTPAEGSTSGQGGGLVRLVGETSSTSFENPSISVDLWPVGNAGKRSTSEMVKETNDTFDDWQDFATSGQVHIASFNQARDMMEDSTVSHKEIDLDSWFMGDSREARNANLANGNNAMLNDCQGFTSSDQSQTNSSNIGGDMMNLSFEQHEATDSVQSWVNGSNKEATNITSTYIESDAFDIWQDFAKSGHQQENMSNIEREAASVSPEPAKEIDAMGLWLTSNFKESNNNEGVRRIDDSSDGWQDLASFGPAQRSTKLPGEGHLVKDPPGTETLDLWASSHAKEKNVEQINENNDPCDDWQDFKNSGETSLQVFSDALSLDRPSASRPDALVGLELGSFSQLASSQNQKDGKESSNVAQAIPFDEHLKSTNIMQQMGNVDSLSAIWPTKGRDNDAILKPESVDANVEKVLSQMHDLSFMLKDELSVPDKPVDHSKS
ncbi:uncharacterized protein LOC133898788 [Phragmites australis]|uniref:uncharacterized protein LOC133898788 n=1 Tax=Phragmites australis TaxID=29695 RepID=UPI002D79291C|nr:uncharacterized protein LOC133898788 [Phragmites australis]